MEDPMTTLTSMTESNLPDVFTNVESEVRSYCRGWPTTMATATGSWITDADGRRYLDLFGGAGALRSEEHTSELQSRGHRVCRLLLEKKKTDRLYCKIQCILFDY